MVRLLDTESMPVNERAEAVAAATRSARVPADFGHEGDGDVHATIDYWNLSNERSLLHRRSSGFRLTRGPRQVRAAAEDRLALTLLSPGRWQFTQGDRARVEDSRTWKLIMVDQAAPYRFLRPGGGSTVAFGFDRASTGVPDDLLRTAAGQLERSPLYELMSDHLRHLWTVLDQESSGSIDAMIGTATTELARALIISAVTDHPAPAEPARPELLTLTQQYIDRHLSERDLTPARIARVHHVSVRQLYAAWSANDQSLATYVMAQRLEMARRLLAHRGQRSRTISAVAAECGFVDLPHFSRRFRKAFGLSPREWRRLTQDPFTTPAS